MTKMLVALLGTRAAERVESPAVSGRAVAENPVLWPTKRRLCIDDPLLAFQLVQECEKSLLVLQGQACSVKAQPISAKGTPKAIEKLAAENAAQNLYR